MGGDPLPIDGCQADREGVSQVGRLLLGELCYARQGSRETLFGQVRPTHAGRAPSPGLRES